MARRKKKTWTPQRRKRFAATWRAKRELLKRAQIMPAQLQLAAEPVVILVNGRIELSLSTAPTAPRRKK